MITADAKSKLIATGFKRFLLIATYKSKGDKNYLQKFIYHFFIAA